MIIRSVYLMEQDDRSSEHVGFDQIFLGNSNGENDDTLVLGAPHTDTKTRVFWGVNSWDFMAEKDLLPSGYD